MDQSLINAGIGLIGALMGFLLKALWDADAALLKKVQDIEVLVAGKYVTWDGLKDVISPLSVQLTRIEAKLDMKVDRVECQAHHK